MRAALGDQPECAKPAQPVQASTQQPLLGLRVLLAEDNPINALLARTLLTKAGCSVTSAQDGEEAVAVASAAAFDLILLDIRMPRLMVLKPPSASAPEEGLLRRAHRCAHC